VLDCFLVSDRHTFRVCRCVLHQHGLLQQAIEANDLHLGGEPTREDRSQR
jgi:hypothetical protein